MNPRASRMLERHRGRETRSSLANPTPELLALFGCSNSLTASGKHVTPEIALTYTAVAACVNVLAETVAMLPFQLFERQDGEVKGRAVDHPLYNVLRMAPNPVMTAFRFREGMMMNLCTRGNAYAEIQRKDGVIVALWPLHPDTVRVKVDTLRTGLIYEITDPGTTIPRQVLQREMYHLRWRSQNGVMGLNPVAAAREAIGMGLALQENGANLFGQGTRPSGIVSHDGNPTKEQRDQFIETLRKSNEGVGNSGKNIITWGGWKWQAMSFTPEDAQFLETRKFQVEEIARMFRIPPHKIGHLEKSTNNNIEHQGLEFHTDSMMPWLVRWQEDTDLQLLTETERKQYYSEFLTAALLRGDYKSRMEGYQIAISNGIFSPDECRDFENHNPRNDGYGGRYLKQATLVYADEPSPAAGPIQPEPAQVN